MNAHDKRLPLNQVIQMVHDHYDLLELASLEAARRALRVEFGFGKKRHQRFKEKYLELLGEEAEKLTEDMRKKLKKRVGIK